MIEIATSMSSYLCQRCGEVVLAAACTRCPTCASFGMRPTDEPPTPRRKRIRPRRTHLADLEQIEQYRHHEHASDATQRREELHDEPPDDEPEDAFSLNSEQIERIETGHDSVDDAFAHPKYGRGLPVVGTVMFAGNPGSGKSRLTLEVAARRAASGRMALVVSGEEQKAQIGARVDELDLKSRFPQAQGRLAIYLTNDLGRLFQRIEDVDADDVFVDAMNVIDWHGAPRSDVVRLAKLAEEIHSRSWARAGSRYDGLKRCFIWAICHGTKDGDMAGPMKAKHLVDAAFMLDHVNAKGQEQEDQNESTGFVRLKCMAKNRFGLATVRTFLHMTEPRGILVPYEPIGAASP